MRTGLFKIGDEVKFHLGLNGLQLLTTTVVKKKIYEFWDNMGLTGFEISIGTWKAYTVLTILTRRILANECHLKVGVCLQ